MKKRGLIFVIFLFSMMTISANDYLEIPLQGRGAASNGITKAEVVAGHVLDNVSQGALYVHLPKPEKNIGISIVIIPGGAYFREAIFHEGHDFARWLASEGITGIVYKYRLPNGHCMIPIQDAEEVYEIVRANASEWKINPQKVGVMGFSAGGHYAATVATQLSLANRPNFAVLVYPVISMQKGITHEGSKKNLLGANPTDELCARFSNEMQVSAQTPPTLLFHCDDDKSVVSQNSTLFYNAMKEHKAASTLYIFPSGGHGWGFRSSFKYHEQMKMLLLDWLMLR